MFSITDVTPPEWGDKESGARFVIECLNRWTEALAAYTGKSETSTTKVDKVIEAVTEDDPEAVSLVEEAMEEIRNIILATLNANVNTSVLLFPQLDDAKKAVGSWRSEVNVNVDSDSTESDEDRDLLSEYESLDKGRTMIEGTFNAFGLDVMSLPEKYRLQKSERVNGKNVKVNEWALKFPGKLTSPDASGKTNGNSGFTRADFRWTLTDALGEIEIGRAGIPFLARLCSTKDSLVSVTDLLTSIKAAHGDNWGSVNEINIRTPRGTLVGRKPEKK